MVDRLVEIRRAVFRMRPETVREREIALDSLFEQMRAEEKGSERYDNVATAYRWLKRQPERHRPMVFGKDMPWFW